MKLKIQGGPSHKDTVVNGIPRIGFMTGGKAARWVDEDIADTLATFAALTGQKLAPDAGSDSFNVLPTLLGGKGAKGRDHLVLQNNVQSPLALRQGDWILIQKGGQPGAAKKKKAEAPASELYNLAADPTQSNNLAALQPKRVEDMTARLEQLREQGHSRSGIP